MRLTKRQEEAFVTFGWKLIDCASEYRAARIDGNQRRMGELRERWGGLMVAARLIGGDAVEPYIQRAVESMYRDGVEPVVA